MRREEREKKKYFRCTIIYGLFKMDKERLSGISSRSICPMENSDSLVSAIIKYIE